MKKNNIVFGIVLIIVFLLIIVMLGFIYFEIKNNRVNYNNKSEDGTFSTNFIKMSHKVMKKQNYMISPYSVEIALSMLREGTGGETQKEISDVAPERSIKTLSVKSKVNVANALFIKDIYKKDVKDEYKNLLKSDYNAEIIYDPFKGPEAINNWADRETNGMIKKVVDNIDPQFVMGLGNAIAMEEKWMDSFECERTKGYAFTKYNGKQFDTAMMSKNFDSDVSYFEYEDTKGVIIPYKIYDRSGKEAEEGEQLEFVGFLPNDIDKFIENFDLDYIEKGPDKARKASSDLEISVGLPRFEFDYDFKRFGEVLENMGIKSVFGPGADFTNMLENHDEAYISDAVHKTYVKVDEVGTKAAAVTYFGIKDNAAVPTDKEYVSVIFDKPFVFMIKDHASHEILFFGVVYEPEKWDANKTCE